MIESVSNKLVYTVGSGTQFAFNLRFTAPEEIHCYILRGNEETELVRGVDFSVEVKSDYSSGALITLTPGSDLLPELPAGAVLSICRELPYIQSTALPDHGKLPSEMLELQLDKLVMMIQQLREICSRALTVPHGMTDSDADSVFQNFHQLARRAETAADAAEASQLAAAAAAAMAVEIADLARQVIAYYRDLELNKVTLELGPWSPTDSGVLIDYGVWTPTRNQSES